MFGVFKDVIIFFFGFLGNPLSSSCPFDIFSVKKSRDFIIKLLRNRVLCKKLFSVLSRTIHRSGGSGLRSYHHLTSLDRVEEVTTRNHHRSSPIGL